MSLHCGVLESDHYELHGQKLYSQSPMIHCDSLCPYPDVRVRCEKKCAYLTAQARPCMWKMVQIINGNKEIENVS